MEAAHVLDGKQLLRWRPKVEGGCVDGRWRWRSPIFNGNVRLALITELTVTDASRCSVDGMLNRKHFAIARPKLVYFIWHDRRAYLGLKVGGRR